MTVALDRTPFPGERISTHLNYFLDEALGGKRVYYATTASAYRRKFDPRLVEIQDIRGSENNFSLDVHGFTFCEHESVEKEFDDVEKIKQDVYGETADLVKHVTGANVVHVISHVIRRHRFETGIAMAEDLADDHPLKLSTPARSAHIDFSYDGAHDFIHDNLTEELATKISKTRWAIINVWRPIHHPASRDPLAVCDARTVPEADLLEMITVVPKSATHKSISSRREIKGWNMHYNPDHRWYFASDMKPNEVLFIKMFDSKEDVQARRTPHSSFVNPGTNKEEYPTRESIEFRCVVAWNNDSTS